MHALGLSRVALLVSMGDCLPDVGLLQRVENVPEVVVVGLPALRELVREEPHESLVALNLRPEFLHAQLVVPGHVHLLDGVHLHELLLIR